MYRGAHGVLPRPHPTHTKKKLVSLVLAISILNSICYLGVTVKKKNRVVLVCQPFLVQGLQVCRQIMDPKSEKIHSHTIDAI